MRTMLRDRTLVNRPPRGQCALSNYWCVRKEWAHVQLNIAFIRRSHDTPLYNTHRDYSNSKIGLCSHGLISTGRMVVGKTYVLCIGLLHCYHIIHQPRDIQFIRNSISHVPPSPAVRRCAPLCPAAELRTIRTTIGRVGGWPLTSCLGPIREKRVAEEEVIEKIVARSKMKSEPQIIVWAETGHQSDGLSYMAGRCGTPTGVRQQVISSILININNYNIIIKII